MEPQLAGAPSAPKTGEPISTGSLLILGLEEAWTRACLLEPINSQYRLAGWLSVQRTPEGKSAQQVAETCRRLGVRLGRRLWDETQDEPLLQSTDVTRCPAFEQVAVVASPRPHVRVWLAGLSQGLSLAVAQQAVASSPAQLAGVTSLTVETNATQLALELDQAQPEALVIVGGYDDPEPATQRPLLLLCKMLGQALARLSPPQRPVILYAGNRWAATQAERLLRVGDGPIQWTALGNLQPVPGLARQAEVAVALSYHYWRLCERTVDFATLGRWVTSPGQITNLEVGFAQIVQAWLVYQRLPDLHALYCSDSWWLHIWASQVQNGVQMRFVPPKTRPPDLADWPPLQLVSGEWPVRLWPQPPIYWWDRTGLAPLMAGIGQVTPVAMLQVLTLDLLEAYGKQKR